MRKIGYARHRLYTAVNRMNGVFKNIKQEIAECETLTPKRLRELADALEAAQTEVMMESAVIEALQAEDE